MGARAARDRARHRGEAAAARADAQAATEICTRLRGANPLLWVAAALGAARAVARGRRGRLGRDGAAWPRRMRRAASRSRSTSASLPATLEALDRARRARSRRAPARALRGARAAELDRVWALADERALPRRCWWRRAAISREPRRPLSMRSPSTRGVEMPFELRPHAAGAGPGQRAGGEQKRAARRGARARARALRADGRAAVGAARARGDRPPRRARRPGRADAVRGAGGRAGGARPVEQGDRRGRCSSTVHTVEVHLSHAYAKLGIRSRPAAGGAPSPTRRGGSKFEGFRYFAGGLSALPSTLWPRGREAGA